MLRASIKATESVAADATCDGEASCNQTKEKKIDIIYMQIEARNQQGLTKYFGKFSLIHTNSVRQTLLKLFPLRGSLVRQHLQEATRMKRDLLP